MSLLAALLDAYRRWRYERIVMADDPLFYWRGRL